MGCLYECGGEFGVVFGVEGGGGEGEEVGVGGLGEVVVGVCGWGMFVFFLCFGIEYEFGLINEV